MEETLFLTVNLIDRFLECETVVRKKLQLVGVTALLLACKYEEISVPLVDDLIFISDQSYTRKEILQMVSCLRWHLVSDGYFLSNFKTVKNLKSFISMSVPIGEGNGECTAIQHVCSNTLRIYEEISQGCSSR